MIGEQLTTRQAYRGSGQRPEVLDNLLQACKISRGPGGLDATMLDGFPNREERKKKGPGRKL